MVKNNQKALPHILNGIDKVFKKIFNPKLKGFVFINSAQLEGRIEALIIFLELHPEYCDEVQEGLFRIMNEAAAEGNTGNIIDHRLLEKIQSMKNDNCAISHQVSGGLTVSICGNAVSIAHESGAKVAVAACQDGMEISPSGSSGEMLSFKLTCK